MKQCMIILTGVHVTSVIITTNLNKTKTPRGSFKDLRMPWYSRTWLQAPSHTFACTTFSGYAPLVFSRRLPVSHSRCPLEPMPKAGRILDAGRSPLFLSTSRVPFSSAESSFTLPFSGTEEMKCCKENEEEEDLAEALASFSSPLAETKTKTVSERDPPLLPYLLKNKTLFFSRKDSVFIFTWNAENQSFWLATKIPNKEHSRDYNTTSK